MAWILLTNDDGIDVESWKYLNENAAHCKYKAFNKENNTEGNWKIIARRAMNTIGFVEICSRGIFLSNAFLIIGLINFIPFFFISIEYCK